MSLNKAFGGSVYTEKTINVEMNYNHARSLWAFIKTSLDKQMEKGEFEMSKETAVKVMNAWDSLAKALDKADKAPYKDAYGNVTVPTEAKEIE